jgi:hypothetical protein
MSEVGAEETSVEGEEVAEEDTTDFNLLNYKTAQSSGLFCLL